MSRSCSSSRVFASSSVFSLYFLCCLFLFLSLESLRIREVSVLGSGRCPNPIDRYLAELF
jgi:hypothetical protein